MKIPSHVLSQKVGDEMVLLDLEGETYFGLDAVGTRAWELIESGIGADQLVRQMLGEYEVDEGRLRADLSHLISDLESHGLLLPSNADT